MAIRSSAAWNLIDRIAHQSTSADERGVCLDKLRVMLGNAIPSDALRNGAPNGSGTVNGSGAASDVSKLKLQMQVAELMLDNHKVRGELRTAQSQVFAMQDEINEVRKQLAEAKRELRSAREEAKAVREQLAEAQRELHSVQNEMALLRATAKDRPKPAKPAQPDTVTDTVTDEVAFLDDRNEKLVEQIAASRWDWSMAERVEFILDGFTGAEILSAHLGTLVDAQCPNDFAEVREAMEGLGWRSRLVWQDAAPHQKPRGRGYKRG